MKKWSFTENPFLAASKRSYSLSLKISTHHYSQLEKNSDDPFFAGMRDSYYPLHKELEKRRSEWKSQGGIQKGSTQMKDELFHNLNESKIADWELAVRNVFREKTPEYTTLFPKGIGAFKRGTIENRIGAVKAFLSTLQNYPQLAVLADEVATFYNELMAIRVKQLGNKGETNIYSAALEKAVHAAMLGMYGNLGGLIQHFRATPEDIKDFFDLEAMRNT